MTRWNNRGLVVAVVGLALALGPGVGQGAEKKPLEELLPDSTVLLVRIANASEFFQKARQTALGRMLEDEQIRPLVSQLYGAAAEGFSRVQERLGITLDQLVQLPSGQLALALVAAQEGPPALVFLIDVGSKAPQVHGVFQRFVDGAAGGGARWESLGQRDGATWYRVTDRRNRQSAVLERDGVFCLISDFALAEEMLRVWDGQSGVKTLAERPSFGAVLKRCSSGGKSPDAFAYLDPIGLVQAVGRQNIGVQTFLLLLPGLGLDAVEAAGAGMTLGVEPFDYVTHVHVLVQGERRGLLRAVALRDGDWTPEAWVPANAASYATLFWDLEATYQEVAKIFDDFRGEGALAELLQNGLGNRIGVDVVNELLPQLAGRFSLATWIEQPIRLNSNATLVGIHLRDGEKFRPVFQRVADRFAQQLERKNWRGVEYWRLPSNRSVPADMAELMRQPTPCVALLGDFILFSDSEALMKEAISVTKGASATLADELDFKLIASTIQRQSAGAKPSMVSFDRPEEGMQALYSLANSVLVRRSLERAAESNPAARALHQALQQHPLPPFSRIARYLAPGGAFLTSDQSGFHYMSFSLRREESGQP